jgi:predicted MFS family arabinose efflux permease
LGVANIYYAQPLAATMANDLGVTQGAMGIALMASQLGYALGMIFLVPLGDGRERRGLMAATAAASSLALLLVAAAPSFPALAVASLALGFASSLPQMVVPFAVGLVRPEHRGRAIGTVMGGLLSGILLSRTASGAIGELLGWRWTFVAAAGFMAGLTAVLRLALPPQHPPEPLPFWRILASLGQVVRGEPLLRRHAVIGALGFGSFSVFWSTLSFHLATLGYGSSTAGMFGAVGVAGVAVAPLVGRLAGRVATTLINAVALATVAISFAVFGASGTSLVALGLGVVLLDTGVQANHLANQTLLLGLRPALRNRINAVYMVTYFIGGALGTAIGAAAWAHAGWLGVCAAGAALALLGLVPLARRA